MEQKQLLKLCEAAHNAPSADNSQPWRFIVSTNNITIAYDAPRVLKKTFPADNIATLLSMGSVIEAIVQTCIEHNVKYSLDTTLDVSNGSTAYASFSFKEEVSEKFTLKKDTPTTIRHTNRFAYKTQQPSKKKIETLIRDINTSSTTINWADDRTSINKISSLIKSASEIRFQTPEVHEWLMQSLRFDNRVEHEDGLHISTLDLPPLGGAFMKFIAPWERTQFLNNMGLYKLMATIEAQPISNAPGLISISCNNTATAQLQAGRDLFNIWLKLNMAGLAVHPYFVITDQISRLHEHTVPNKLIPQAHSLEEKTREQFGLAEKEGLCMLFRVGYPKKIAIRSKRLDLMDVVTIIND